MMWISGCAGMFAAGYAASVYSWPSIKVWINGAWTLVGKRRTRAAKFEAKLRNI